MFAAPGFGDNGGGEGDHGGKRVHQDRNRNENRESRFTMLVQTTDTGSCGNTWATLSLRRQVEVKGRGAHVFRLELRDSGTFTTLAGRSPGACASDDEDHGMTVLAGHMGKVRGDIEAIVRNGVFNPNARPAAGSDLAAFVSALFGPNASFSCTTMAAKCDLEARFRAFDNQANRSLILRRFERKLEQKDEGMRTELDGDIADH